MIQRAGKARFAAQCIPTDSELLTVDAYDRFLATRRKMIAEQLNTFLAGGVVGA